MTRRRLVAVSLLLFAVAGAPFASDEDQTGEKPAQPAGGPSLRMRMLAAEDERARTPQAMAPLLEGLNEKNSELQRIAVRALGRFERPELFATIAPAVLSQAPEVRIEAINAIAQTAGAAKDAGPASDLLTTRLEAETHPLVRGALCQAIGRLPYSSPEQVAAAEAAIMRVAFPTGADRPSPSTLLGAIRGIESLARLNAKIRPLSPELVKQLRAFALPLADTSTKTAAASATFGPDRLLKREALMALAAGNGMDEELSLRALGSFNPEMRRLAVTGLINATGTAAAQLKRVIRADSAPGVRYEALRTQSRRPEGADCGTLLGTLMDQSPAVALLAVDLMATSCTGSQTAVTRLAREAEALALRPLQTEPEGERRPAARSSSPGAARVPPPDWHRSAHALVSLAKLDAARAAGPLGRASTDKLWLIRMYVGRAARAAKQVELLNKFAADEHPNVRNEAVAGLSELRGHEADAAYISALESDDGQLLMTAAKALEKTPAPAPAIDALLAALDRVTALKRDTSRDPRRALIDRIAELGTAETAPRLRPYLTDFDVTIAGRAAEIIKTWTGEAVTASPRPLPPPPLPTEEQLVRLDRSRAVISIRGRGDFELRLLGTEAPLSAWRFVKLAEARYYNGLTFHRIVPNFVIQGGSPMANEYAGDGPYLRDEMGLPSHLRGTVGISTRGRDTGDAQIFVNLVDNLRLDHNYTIIGVVEKGMEVVDALLEGDVIDDIEIRGAS